MMKNLTKGLAALALALSVASPVTSETRQACAERTKVIERLAEKYGETRQAMGLHQNNGVLEVYASEETGTWTILVTMPNGLSCLIAAGQGWDGVADPVKPKGDPA